MKQLVIIGAGGFGREILGWAKGCAACNREWEIAGFLDDRADALSPFNDIGLPIIGGVDTYQPRPDQVFIIALGEPKTKARIRRQFKAMNAQFTRIIHESCVVGRGVDLEDGVILCPGVTLTCDISIGANTALNINTAVGHDARIGSDCQISSFCDITGHVRIGDQCLLGSRVSIIPSMEIGNQTVVGAGSVVVSNVPDSVTVFGNPARILTRHT